MNPFGETNFIVYVPVHLVKDVMELHENTIKAGTVLIPLTITDNVLVESYSRNTTIEEALAVKIGAATAHAVMSHVSTRIRRDN